MHMQTTLDTIDSISLSGKPSKWFSVPGSFFSEIDPRCAWRLNHSSWVPFTAGPDGARLVSPGDFVLDIPWSEVNCGKNLLEIGCVDGQAMQIVYAKEFHAELDPPLQAPISLGFSTVPSASQTGYLLIDGLWRHTGEGITPVRPGYDRLLAFGDLKQSDFQVRAILTIHHFVDSQETPKERTGPGAGILLRWNGHHADTCSPWREWRPIGALAWYRFGRDLRDTVRDYRLQLLGGRWKEDTLSEPLAEDTTGKHLPLNTPLVFVAEVRSKAGEPSTYRFKAWPLQEQEPSTWDLTAQGLDGELPQGSALIVLHHASATVHSILLERFDAVSALTASKDTLAPSRAQEP